MVPKKALTLSEHSWALSCIEKSTNITQASSCPADSNWHKPYKQQNDTNYQCAGRHTSAGHLNTTDSARPVIKTGLAGKNGNAIKPVSSIALGHLDSSYPFKWRYSDQSTLEYHNSARKTDRSSQAGLGPRIEVTLVGLVM